MAIVTISHQMGAGGTEIGTALAQRMGYHYVDHELLEDAVRRYGVAEEKLSHLDETKPSLFERFDAETRHYITVLQTTLLEFAEADDVVLMGRGGQWPCAAFPRAAVRIIAPFEQRGAPVSDGSSRSPESPNQRSVVDSCADDARRPAACAYLYEVDIVGSNLYDLVVNTERLKCRPVVEMLEGGRCAGPRCATTDAGRRVVASRGPASRVQVASPTHPDTRYRVTVEADAGVVTLEDGGSRSGCGTARTVPGSCRSRPSRWTSRPSRPSGVA
jgi:cytidylate kinase